ncbi:MAG TPA: hypothetical protein ENJ95_02740 [Bacteroidetes bacterium]|nr:hypothetical protein [Bacteroidota bacterium]
MNYNFLSRNGVSVALGIAVIALLIMAVPIFMGIDAFNALPEDIKIRATSDEGNIFGAGLKVAIALGVIAILLAILLSFFGMFKNFKEARTGLISFALLAILFFALYSMTSTSISESMMETVNTYSTKGNMNVYKMISGGINGTLILTVVAFGLMIVMEIWNFFKNS